MRKHLKNKLKMVSIYTIFLVVVLGKSMKQILCVLSQ